MKTYNILSKLSLLLLASFALGACSDIEDSVQSIEVPDYQLTVEGTTKTISILEKEVLQLQVLVTPTSAHNKNLKFELESAEVASVTQMGKLTGLAVGTDKLTITALGDSKIVATYSIEVVARIVKAEKIELVAAAKDIILANNTSYDLSSKFQFTPKDVTDKRVKYESLNKAVIEVSDAGVVTALSLGEAEVIITSLDGSGVFDVAKFTVVDKVLGPIDYSRENWGVKVSHDLPIEGGNNSGDCIIDGDDNTFLSIIKPGFSMDGITVGLDETVFFTVDMKKKQEVDYFRYVHRNEYVTLRYFTVSIFGSDDGKTFTAVKENVELPGASDGGTSTIDSGNISIPKTSYQYYKVVFMDWNRTSAAVGQLREFYLGRTIE